MALGSLGLRPTYTFLNHMREYTMTIPSPAAGRDAFGPAAAARVQHVPRRLPAAHSRIIRAAAPRYDVTPMMPHREGARVSAAITNATQGKGCLVVGY